MPQSELPDLSTQYRIDQPDQFRIAGRDAAGQTTLTKDDGKDLLEKLTARIAALQDMMYAQDSRSLLIVLQGMDTAGKDGIIEHVLSAINPQGCTVHPFKQPTSEELDHDFLWRAARRLPERGHIGVFNRSYYEDVIVVRVHPEYLKGQKLPVISKTIWQDRFEDIRSFERHLVRNGTAVMKFFLNISEEEQRQRLLARIDEPGKQWKFSMGDIAERALWPKYMEAYEDMIRSTSMPDAPWFVVPADRKWFARIVVASAVVQAMEGLGLKYPEVNEATLKELAKVRKALEAAKPTPK